jgi:hypothetical protein
MLFLWIEKNPGYFVNLAANIGGLIERLTM